MISFFMYQTKAANPTEPVYTEEKKDTRKEGLDIHKERISTQKLSTICLCNQRDRISPSKRSPKFSQRE
jgi:hypothetical protein